MADKGGALFSFILLSFAACPHVSGAAQIAAAAPGEPTHEGLTPGQWIARAWQGNAEQRVRALAALRRFPAAADALTAFLNDPERQVRRAAIAGLAELGERGRPALPALQAILPQEPDAVCQALVALGPAALPVLYDAATAPSPTVRGPALTAIAQLVPIYARGALLLQNALQDDDPSVRARALKALANVQQVRSLRDNAALLQRVLHLSVADAALECRDAAVGVLVAWKPPQATPTLLGIAANPLDPLRGRALSELHWQGTPPRELVPVLRPCLEDDDAYLRLWAARALAHLGDGSSAVVGALVDGLGDARTANADLFLAALVALGPKARTAERVLWDAWEQAEDAAMLRRLTDALVAAGPVAENRLPAVLKAAKGPSSMRRRQAARLLGTIGKKDLPALAALLDDPEPAVRLEAAATLLRAGADGTPLLGLVRDVLQESPTASPTAAPAASRGRLMEQVAAVCTALGPAARPLIPHLLKRLEEDSEARRPLASALAALGDDGIRAGIELLAHADPKLRRLGIGLVKNGRGAVAFQALWKLATSDPNEGARLRALEALASFPRECRAVTAGIRAMLEGHDPATQLAAARLLLDLGEPPAKHAARLLSLFESPQLEQHASVAGLLSRIGAKASDAAPRLVVMLPKAAPADQQLLLEVLADVRADAVALAPLLRDLLASSHAGVRRAAADALWRLDSSAATTLGLAR